MRNGGVIVDSSHRRRNWDRSKRRRHAVVVLAVGSCVLIAGCSDDSDGATTSASSSTSASTVSTTGATTVTSSTPPSTTTPSTTTTSTTIPATSPPDTSGSVTSVSVDLPPGYDEMIAAFRQYEDVLRSCRRQAAECDYAALDAVVAPDLRASYHDVLDQVVADGLIGIPGATASYTNLVNVFTGDGGVVTGVEACRVDGDIAVRVNDPVNPADDEVVDDSVASFKVRIGFAAMDGVWMTTGETVDETIEGNVCGPPDV